MKKFLAVLSLSLVFMMTTGCASTGGSQSAQSGAQSGKLTIYAVRHGQTILNLMDKAQGWSDGVLTEKGVSGAVNMGKGLRDVRFGAVYSSDLGRAVNTARLAMAENKATRKWAVNELPELREVGFGPAEGLPNVDMYLAFMKATGIAVPEGANTGAVMGALIGHFKGSFADMLLAMCDYSAKADTTYKLAESSADVKARVKKGLDQIVSENQKGGNVMVVAHGLTIMFAIMEMGLDMQKLPPAGLENSSVTKIIYDYAAKTFTFDGVVGDMSYMEAGEKL